MAFGHGFPEEGPHRTGAHVGTDLDAREETRKLQEVIGWGCSKLPKPVRMYNLTTRLV